MKLVWVDRSTTLNGQWVAGSNPKYPHARSVQWISDFKQTSANLDKVKRGTDGKDYLLVQYIEKKYRISWRIWLCIVSIVQILFRTLLRQSTEKAKDKWFVSLTGKRLIAIYEAKDSLLSAIFNRVVRHVANEYKHPTFLDDLLNALPTERPSTAQQAMACQAARQTLLDYINEPEHRKALCSQNEKILKIYDRLTTLPKEQGRNWADAIDKDLLLEDEPEQDSDDFHFPHLKEMILENVFIPDAPEEQIFENQEAPHQAYAEDHQGQSYVFTRRRGLDAPSNTMLFHIQADEFGSSSKLEGGESGAAVRYLHKFLRHYPPCSQGLFDQVGNALEIKENALGYRVDKSGILQQAKQKVSHAFNQTAPLLIIGGWTGKPSGHAIYYEIIPDSNQKANFRLYNTGAGISDHSSALQGHKVKYQTYKEWRGIDRANLESPHFLEALYELSSHREIPGSYTGTEYQQQDIYQGLKDLLQPKAEINGPQIQLDEDLFMTPQRTGVCSWKSLMAFMRTKINLNDYKRFKCDIKLQSLADHVDILSHLRKFEPNDWRLIKKSHQNLCRSILKLHQRKLVGEAYIQEAQKELNVISDWLRKHANCRYERPSKSLSSVYLEPRSGTLENKHGLEHSLEKLISSGQSDTSTKFQIHQQILDQFRQIDTSHAQTLNQAFDKAVQLGTLAWQERDDLSLHKGLIDFISNLKIEGQFWKQAIKGQQEAEKWITQLGELAELFLKSCFTSPQQPVIFPEKMYVLYKTLYLQQLLCRLSHPTWKKLNLIDDQLACSDYFFLSFSNASMHQEMENILSQYEYSSDVQINGYHHTYPRLSGSVGFTFNFSEGRTSMKHFQDRLQEEYPEIIKSIAEESSFKSLAKFAQDAHIYASHHLPDWIKAMRNTQLAFRYMKEGAIGPLPSFDRQKDLKFQFKTKDEQEQTEVKISLSGVNSDILKTREVTAVQRDRYLRYAGQYPDITSTPIKQFIDFLFYSPYFTEKWLANTSVKERRIEMSEEEFKELARLFIRSDLQLIETIEYFTKYPEKLQETDYQTLFHVLLFKLGNLNKNLKIKGFESQLAHFVQKNYEHFNEENHIQPAVFLLRLSHQLKSFCSHQAFYQQTLDNLKSMLKRENLEEEAKLLIYAELIAELKVKPSLTEEEIFLLLKGSVYLEENQSHSKYKIDPLTQREAKVALLVHANQIKDTLEAGNPNQAFLNRLLSSLRPHSQEEKWNVKRVPGEFPSFETDPCTHIFYPLLSRLISPHVQTLLPFSIRQNFHFRQLFSGIEKGYYLGNNVFSFKDARAQETRIYLKDEHLVVEQQQQGEWVRYVPSDTFLQENGNKLESSLGSRYLAQHYTHWQTLETNKIYANDPKTGQRKYVFTIKEVNGHFQVGENGNLNKKSCFRLEEIQDLSSTWKLGKASSFLESFEDLAYIHEWYDAQDRLKALELPRFNLSFKPSAKDPKILICDQFPSYRLNTTASIKQLGTHHHYILLENDQGQQKVILSEQDLQGPREKEVLLPKYELNRCLGRQELERQKYYVFDVQKKGKLFSKSREANLYLAEVLTAAQEYKKAASYLKECGPKLSAYTEREAKILKDMANTEAITGDISGNGTILQLYAAYLLFKNRQACHQKSPGEAKELATISALYNRYIALHPNATVFKLSVQEEVFLLKTFLSRTFNVIHFLRLKELDPIAAKKIDVPAAPPQQEPQQEKIKKTLEDFNLPNWSDLREKVVNPPSPALVTRSSQKMERYFLYFYNLARQGSDDEKERMRASLTFVRMTQAGKANFFEAVLDNSQLFPDFPDLPDIKDPNYVSIINDWRKKVRSIAEQCLDKQPPLVIPASSAAANKMPDKFYLGKPQLKQTPLSPTITFPSLSSLAEEAKKILGKGEPESPKDTTHLKSLLEACHSKDPVQNREVDRLIEDLKVSPPSPPRYSIDQQQLALIKTLLAKDKKSDQDTLLNLEKEIVALANKKPASSLELSERHIKKWGQVHKVITLEELIVGFGRKDLGQFLQRNPALTEEDLKQLAKQVGQFLLHATRHQQRERAEESLSKLESCPADEQSDLMGQLAERLLATRAYEPLEYPAYLVFEYFANILMHASQVEKLDKFLKGTEPNLVMEMIMGSGKSKVLLPLLGLLRADGKTLSMLIVPQPLFESVSQDTQAALQNFSQALSTLHFDRHTKFTKDSLEAIFDELKAIRENKGCLIMTSKSMQCLLIKFIEEYSKYLQENDKKELKDLSTELHLMQKILCLIHENGYPIIDEADTVLNVLHEVSFSLGKHLSPERQELELLAELFNLLYNDPDIKALAQLESDPQPQEIAPHLTEQLYFNKIQEPLAKKMMDRLGQMRFDSPSLTEKVHQFMAGLNEERRRSLLQYVCRSKEHLSSAQAFFDSLDPEIQNIVALVGEEISHLLPYTLTRICDERYGLDHKSKHCIAVPFSASQTPSSGSQFSNAHITMNYTFQTYVKKGVTQELVEAQVQLLQEKAMREIASSGGKLAIKETEAGQLFAKLKGSLPMPLFNYKPADIENLVRKINENPQAKISFVSHIILPQLEQFQYKISCNPHNLVAFFLKAAGFTGTLWNGTSMHHTLKPEPAKGTDAKTLNILWENSRGNALMIKEGSIPEMLSQLNSQGASFDMISDAGGYFKTGTNSDMAHQIASLQGKETVFYNAQGEQTITDGIKEMPFSQTTKLPQERLTFLDQARTTGADVPQKLDATGLVTIGRNMLLRDLLQSVWRLRGLAKSQRVRFVVSEEVAGIIRQKLNLDANHSIQLENILKFVIANQAFQQGRDNYRALKGELATIIQKILLEVSIHPKLTPLARMQAMAHLQSTWIKLAFFNAKELYGRLPAEVEAEKVVALDKQRYVLHIKQVFKNIPWLDKIGITEEKCLKEVEVIMSKIKDSLTEKLPLPIQEIDNDQTVEVEQEMRTEREVQLEVQEAAEKEKICLQAVDNSTMKEYESFTDVLKLLEKEEYLVDRSDKVKVKRYKELPLFPLNAYLGWDQHLKPYASAFDGINLSVNVLEWTEQKDSHQLLGVHRTDFHHLYVEGSKVTLLTQTEADRKDARYYNLTLGFNDPNQKPSQEQLFKIVKLKFLNGESQFSAPEIKFLRAWFRSQGMEKMQKLFVEFILNGRPKKAARYQGSPLQNLFAQGK